MNKQEQERRAKLIATAKERLPGIKEQFEEAQNRHFNSNFQPAHNLLHYVLLGFSTLSKEPFENRDIVCGYEVVTNCFISGGFN